MPVRPMWQRPLSNIPASRASNAHGITECFDDFRKLDPRQQRVAGYSWGVVVVPECNAEDFFCSASARCKDACSPIIADRDIWVMQPKCRSHLGSNFGGVAILLQAGIASSVTATLAFGDILQHPS